MSSIRVEPSEFSRESFVVDIATGFLGNFLFFIDSQEVLILQRRNYREFAKGSYQGRFRQSNPKSMRLPICQKKSVK